MSERYRWLVTIRPHLSIGPDRYVETVETADLDPVSAVPIAWRRMRRRSPDNQLWQSRQVTISVERIP